MDSQDIIKIAQAAKRGSFIRIVYVSDLLISASARRAGHIVQKRTEKVVRLGVNYTHIAQVIAQEALRTGPKRETTSWCHWIIPNILAKHNFNDAYYLTVANVNNGHHSRSKYFIDGVESSFDDVVDSGYVLPSYFRFDTREAPVVQTIRIENIIELGGSRS